MTPFADSCLHALHQVMTDFVKWFADSEDADRTDRNWGDLSYLEATGRLGDYLLRDPSPFVRGAEVQLMRMFNAARTNELQDVREMPDVRTRNAGASALFISWHIGAVLSGPNAVRWQVLTKIH